jgi:DNA-binding GntR family transcriptional regulator
VSHETGVNKSYLEESVSSPKAEPLGHQAYHVLRRAIREGIIQSDRYYSETEFAGLLGVSRTPVREALKRLERDGVLEVAPQRGYRLRSFSEQEVTELIELRKALEHLIITTLIARANEQHLEKLAKILERQESGDIATEIFTLDEEFHLTMAELAGLSRTKEILAALRSAMAIIGAGAQVSRERTRQAAKEHRQLLDAIVSRDSQAAVSSLDRHVEASTKALLEGRRMRATQRTALRLASN